MPQHDIFHDRKQFQLERMILFSDAVFAIVITLLVIDIKIPSNSHTGLITQMRFNEYLSELVPDLVGFFFSFFIVGFYWTAHHRMFGFIMSYDRRLIWLNLLMLLFIALLPFTTSIISKYGYLREAFMLYSFNVGFIGLISFFIQIRIGNPARKLSVGLEDRNLRHYFQARALCSCLVFFCGGLLCLMQSSTMFRISRFSYLLLIPCSIILKRVYGIRKSKLMAA